MYRPRLRTMTCNWTMEKFVFGTLAILTLLQSPCSAVISSGIACPEWCQCQRAGHPSAVIADCSNKGLQEVPSDLDPSLISLDLSGNHIQKIRSGAFLELPTLSTVLLNDNWIREIEPHAFKGLNVLRTLDLRRNALETLEAESLSSISGAEDCLDPSESCSVLLQENPLKVIRSYALSWWRRLSVNIGNSTIADLTLEAYSFYGSEELLDILIFSIPTLTLEPRVFTNTDGLAKLKISDTHLNSMEKFTFEGLTNVDKILFDHIYFASISEFAFAGVLYASSSEVLLTHRTGRDHNALLRGGGLLSLEYCALASLPADTFRDTNLQTLSFMYGRIDSIDAHAFRGLPRLKLLEITGNQIGAIKTGALSDLNNVPHVNLTENAIGSLEQHAFKDSQGIERLTLYLKPSSNLTLPSYTFAGLRDVGILDIQGAPGSAFWVSQDAFHDLGGVQTFRIANVSIPHVPEHTFRGLSKVQTLTLEYCNITRIDLAAFGQTRTSGAVATIELMEGNNMPCDCETNKLLRDFERRFAKFSVQCYTEKNNVRVVTADTMNWPACSTHDSGAGGNTMDYKLICICLLSLVVFSQGVR